ncbi:RHS repeat-associated core domain-containing protein [Cryobacterium zhongshanensis]|uniref:RHS repeat-associated core domain-containing protein n=1 Tax=Cryobacterium zhongshanensis TaxID=2928153 RepID=A0AA41QWW4_9MICO|nr:RHS repeat-associated core domain-containing protein [Cryobacterium zhongshanensis]MCI4658078.1 RHS repeat-associated core domain-containing protein [Cryobacterium zhongshanensis]
MTLAPLKAGVRTPYGEARSTGTVVTTNTERYIGAYQETTNLYKLGARYYDATTGRFTQSDPAGQEANPNIYAGCNPINSKDASGFAVSPCGATSVILGLASFALGVAAVALAPFAGGPSLPVMAALWEPLVSRWGQEVRRLASSTCRQTVLVELHPVAKRD